LVAFACAVREGLCCVRARGQGSVSFCLIISLSLVLFPRLSIFYGAAVVGSENVGGLVLTWNHSFSAGAAIADVGMKLAALYSAVQFVLGN